MKSKHVIRYSESFKMQVVKELEEGRHGNYNEAKRAYGIGASSTIIKWHAKYGSTYKKRKFIRVESQADRNEMEQMRQRIRDLERTLSDTTMELCLERQWLKMACKKAGIADVESFKKKADGNACTKSPPQGK